MKNKILILFFVISQLLVAQELKFGQTKGLFMSVGVGPRIPVADLSESHNLGAGFNAAFTYTDNLVLPIFLKGELGFQHLPGRQNFYKSSDYSSISTNLLTLNLGGRYYFPPMVEDVVLLMPIVEAGISFGYFETFHQFKINSGLSNRVEGEVKAGFQAGVGVSMFLLDVIAFYNYFASKQFLSFDLRVQIPVFVTF